MRSKQTFWNFLTEDVFGTENQTTTKAWVAGIAGLIILGFYLNSMSVNFLGIAETRDSYVNFERAVEVQAIHVLPGQKVKAGDLLAEVNQFEIVRRQMEVTAQLQKMEAELNVRTQLSSVFKEARASGLKSDPLVVEINTLKKELLYLEQQKRNLFIFAKNDGVIGAVNFKKGEKVAPFSPIVTVSPESPTLIHGYINENLHTRLKVGQKLQVSSVAGETATVGTVVSVASKITVIPERLLKVASLPAWGREIMLEIPKQNNFLHGEKVTIQPLSFKWGIQQALAENFDQELVEFEVNDITLQATLNEGIKFKPSGLIYLSDLKKYLVTSNNDQRLMLMDDQGNLSSQILSISGLDEISDLQSISTDSKFIYLLSSQSAKINGVREKNRELFLKLSREGFNLKLQDSVQLRPLLVKAMADSNDEKLKSLAMQISKNGDDLEIQAHSIQNDVLYLALKQPRSLNKIFFLQLKEFSRLFSEKKILPRNLSIWVQLTLPGAVASNEYSVSDLTLNQKVLYFATVCKARNCSALWKLDLQSKKTEPVLLKLINNGRLSGIYYEPETNTMMGVLDDNGLSSRYLKASFFENRNR